MKGSVPLANTCHLFIRIVDSLKLVWKALSMHHSFISAIFLFLFSSQSFGNGANGFFVDNLERLENDLDGYSVHYVYSTSGSGLEGYCLNGVRLDTSSILISSGKEDSFSLKDIKMSKKDSCGEQNTLVQFNRMDLNNNDLVILNPVHFKKKKLTKLKIIPFDSVSKHFDLFQKKGIAPKESLKIGDQQIDFKVAYDLNLDGSPDLLIFTQAMDYTHTYLIGKKAKKWVILKIEYPH